jgi:hypothetical protein
MRVGKSTASPPRPLPSFQVFRNLHLVTSVATERWFFLQNFLVAFVFHTYYS